MSLHPNLKMVVNHWRYWLLKEYHGVSETRQIALITQRSQVRILPTLPYISNGYGGCRGPFFEIVRELSVGYDL